VRLAEALEQSTTSMLRRVADAHGLAHRDETTRDELLQRLAQRLTDPAYARELVQQLTEDERSLLGAAHSTDGELRGLLLDSEQPGIAEDLSARGLLFRVFSASGPLRGEVYIVPDEFLRLLPPPTSSTAALPPGEAEPPASVRWTDPAFSLFALASALTRGPVSQVEADLRPWSQEPGAWPWDARWTFLRHLGLSSGLLTHRVDGAVSVGPTLPRLLDDRPELADRLWRSYLNDRGWSELQHAGFAEEGETMNLADDRALRRAVAEVLDQLPSGRWFALEKLSAWIERSRPNLVREQLTPRGLARFQALGWSKLEQRLLRYFLLGPLYWLGLIACSVDASFVSRREPSRSAPAEACTWTESAAELLAPARAQLGTLLRAERYLVLHERGRVSRYHLVQSHFAASLSAGGSLSDCRELLARLTQAPLPRDIAERFETWQKRFGALRIRPAVLLEADSAEELGAALADEPVRPFVRKRMGDFAVEVAAADALELAAALRAGGHLPQVDAALRLAAQPRHAFGGLIDEQVLEFLLVSLLAFQVAWPERLADLEGSTALLERLAHQFPPERLVELRTAANRLAGHLPATPAPGRRTRSVRRPRKL
jgi:hypothetical protein